MLTILVDLLLQFVYRTPNLREVEMHHLVSSHERSRVLAYPQRAENLLKLLFLRLVVVGFEHTQQQALAETAGTDEHEVIGLSLKQGNIHGLVNVIIVSFYYVFKVGHSVW